MPLVLVRYQPQDLVEEDCRLTGRSSCLRKGPDLACGCTELTRRSSCLILRGTWSLFKKFKGHVGIAAQSRGREENVLIGPGERGEGGVWE